MPITLSHFNKVLSIIFVLVLATNCKPQKEDIPLIPIKDLFRYPEKTKFLVSPGGTKVSFLQSSESKWDLYIKNLSDDKIEKLTDFSSERIAGYKWVNDNQILLTNDQHKDENTKLYSINVATGTIKKLTSQENKVVEIINCTAQKENEVIVKANFDNNEEFDLYRLNFDNGNYKLIAENPGNIINWLTDNEGILRIAVKTDGVNTGLLYRQNDKDDFELARLSNFKDMLEPLFFTADNKYIYALSNINRDKAAIVKYDIENDTELETIFEHYEVDAKELLWSEKRNEIIGAAYLDYKMEYKFFTSRDDSLHYYIKNKFQGKEIRYINHSKDENSILFIARSDRSLGTYYLFKIDENKFIEIENLSPWLNEEQMAEMKPVWFRAEDGLSIHGYLTLPPKTEHDNLPVVIIPNNSYWKRAQWGFNREVQFVANRGYAVLQINCRGSYGYGKEYWKSGFKEMGGKIQQDISDGVNWLIEQGIADPDKIAIYGHSYGGYLAMTNVVFNPDLYQCAVSYGGIVDMMAFMSSIPGKYKPFVEMIYETMGNPNTEKEHLKSISPINNVDQIKIPLLIAHGTKDSRVDKKNVDKFVSKLQSRNIPVEYFIGENDGHVFRNEENIFKFYQTFERFLSKNLKGRK